MKKPALFVFAMLCLSFLVFQNLYAQNRKGIVYKITDEENVYYAAIETKYFKYFISEQRNTNWCWAACVQMVLNYQGADAPQEEIVKRVKGDMVNDGGTEEDIVKGADGWEVGGRSLAASYEQCYCKTCKNYREEPDIGRMLAELKDKSPIIARLKIPKDETRASWVITGIKFKRLNGNNVKPLQVILRDPWPGNSDDKTFMDWDEFSNRLQSIIFVDML